jgi:hypothetical protein
MHADQTLKAKELIYALWVLGQAQELDADDEKLSELTARVRSAESEFRVLSGIAR